MICRQILPGQIWTIPDRSRPNKAVPTEETSMREFVRPITLALSAAGLAVVMAIASTGGALAQAKQAPPKQMAPAQAAPPPAQPPAVKQMALTDKQIDGVLAAQKDMDAIT